MTAFRDCVHEVNPPQPWVSTLKFVAHIDAPGYGKAYTCTTCPQTFTVIGETVYNNEELDAPIEMSPEDCI